MRKHPQLVAGFAKDYEALPLNHARVPLIKDCHEGAKMLDRRDRIFVSFVYIDRLPVFADEALIRQDAVFGLRRGDDFAVNFAKSSRQPGLRANSTHQDTCMAATANPTQRPTYSGGCASNVSSPSAKVTQGCLLRVHICRVGLSQDVSSSVPARTRTTPPRGRL